MKENKPIIEVEHLVKRYKKADKNAVDDISFSVQPGEFFAFLGPNGAGKTTTISILTTTLSKTKGKVTIAGFDLDKQIADVRQHIGIIFQNPSLDLYLTAEQNIRLHVGMYGIFPYRPLYRMMPIEYRRRIEELSNVVGLGGLMFKQLKTFSGGMKRKLEIVRSLMHNPSILFLDEPTSGLDPVSRADVWKYIQGVRQKSDVTIFLTTHYLDEAENADRICIVQDGKIYANETPAQLKAHLTHRHMVIDGDNRATLQAELFRQHAQFSGSGPFNVSFTGDTPQALLGGIETPLTRLSIHEPTLEEAYVDMIKHTKKMEVKI